MQIVDDFSSKVGWPLERVETIDADHREMVREPGVRDITAVLKVFERDAVEAYKKPGMYDSNGLLPRYDSLWRVLY